MSQARVEAIERPKAPAAPRVRALGRQRYQVLLIQGVTILALVLAWEIVGMVNPRLNMFFPSIEKILGAGWKMLAVGQLNIHMATTGYEVLWGFVLGAGLGILLGLSFGSSRVAGGIAEPFILYSATMPKIIFYPIFILFLGVGVNSKIGIGMASAFFPIIINTMAGVREVSPAYIKAARTMGAGTLQLYSKVYLPVVVGPIVAGLRVGLGMAIIGTMLAETKVARAGLGFIAIEQYSSLRMAEMYSLIFLIFMATMLLNWIMGLVYHRLTKYRGKQGG